jgi:hypothetical protein
MTWKIKVMKRMTSPISLLILAIGLTIVSVARADAQAPDTSTPKKAAVAFANAVNQGDMKTAHALATGTDAEFAAIKGIGDVYQACNRLAAAATKKFGKDGKLSADDVASLKDLSIDMPADFEAAQEKIDGNKATLVDKSKPNDPNPPVLKKDANGWKMDLTYLDESSIMLAGPQIVPFYIKTVDTVTRNIEGDKYKTLHDALAEIDAAIGALGAK